MKPCGWRMILACLLLWQATSSISGVLPEIDDIPQIEHSAAGADDFGAIVNHAIVNLSNTPINEVINFDPVIEMPPEDATLEQLGIAYSQKLDSRQYPDAVVIAERMVDRSRTEHGADSIELAYAQSDLGAALHHAGNNAEAIEPLRLALQLMKDIRGLFHPDLTGAYAYLGMALQGVGDHTKAIEAMTRAQHLTHREAGTQNLQQMSMIYAKANSLEALGELWESEQLYRAAIKIYRHNYGPDSVETLPALYRLAEWQRNFRAYKPALSTYREALKSLQDGSGVDTPEMIPAMRGMAVTYLLQPQDDVENPAMINMRLHSALIQRPDSTMSMRGRARTFLPHHRTEADRGLRLTRRVAAITEQYPQRFSYFERISAHLELGDWLLLFQHQRQAWDQYAKAWDLTQLIQESAIDWPQYFGQAKLIYAGPALTLDFLGYQYVDQDLWNEFDFQIEPDGRPSHVIIAATNIPTLTRKRSVEYMRLGRFRPAMNEGKPIVTEHFQMKRNYPTKAPDDYGVVSLGAGP